MREPHEVCIPCTQILSLIAIGRPASGIAGSADVRGPRRGSPAGVLDSSAISASDLILVSIASARFKAPSRSISRNALSEPFSFSAALSADSTAARADVSPRTIRSCKLVTVFIGRDWILAMESAQNLRNTKVTGCRVGRLVQGQL